MGINNDSFLFVPFVEDASRCRTLVRKRRKILPLFLIAAKAASLRPKRRILFFFCHEPHKPNEQIQDFKAKVRDGAQKCTCKGVDVKM